MPGTYSMLCGFQISCKPYLILHLYLQTLIAICYTMKHVEANGDWSLFCPNEVLGMADVHSAEFEALYERYEKEDRVRRTVRAQKLWYAILEA